MKNRLFTLLTALLIAVALVFTLVSCGGGNKGDGAKCTHVDADDNGKCDECGADFEDGTDVTEPEEPGNEEPEEPGNEEPEEPGNEEPEEPGNEEPNPEEPNPEEPNPEEPNPEEPNPEEPNPEEPNPEDPNPEEPNPDVPNPEEPGPDEPEPVDPLIDFEDATVGELPESIELIGEIKGNALDNGAYLAVAEANGNKYLKLSSRDKYRNYTTGKTDWSLDGNNPDFKVTAVEASETAGYFDINLDLAVSEAWSTSVGAGDVLSAPNAGFRMMIYDGETLVKQIKLVMYASAGDGFLIETDKQGYKVAYNETVSLRFAYNIEDGKLYAYCGETVIAKFVIADAGETLGITHVNFDTPGDLHADIIIDNIKIETNIPEGEGTPAAPACEHRDADDNDVCDMCDAPFTDAHEVHVDDNGDRVCDEEGCNESVACKHTDEDFDKVCDDCGEDCTAYIRADLTNATVYDFDDLELGLNEYDDIEGSLYPELYNNIIDVRYHTGSSGNWLKYNTYGIVDPDEDGNKQLWIKGTDEPNEHGADRNPRFHIRSEALNEGNEEANCFVLQMDLCAVSMELNAPVIFFYTAADADNKINEDFLVVNVDGDLYLAFCDASSIIEAPIGKIGEEFTLRFEYYIETGIMSVYSDGVKVYDAPISEGAEYTHAEIQFTSRVRAEWRVDNISGAKVYVDPAFEGFVPETEEPDNGESGEDGCEHIDEDFDKVCDDCNEPYIQTPAVSISEATVYDFEDLEVGSNSLISGADTAVLELYDNIKQIRNQTGSNPLKADSYGVVEVDGNKKLFIKGTTGTDLNGGNRNPRIDIYADHLEGNSEANYYVVDMDLTVVSLSGESPTPAFKFYTPDDQLNTVVDDFILVNDGDMLYFSYKSFGDRIDIPVAPVGEEFNLRFEYSVESGFMSIYVDGEKCFDYPLGEGLDFTHVEIQFTTNVVGLWYIDNISSAFVYAD